MLFLFLYILLLLYAYDRSDASSSPICKALNVSMLNSLRGFNHRSNLQEKILQLLEKCHYLNSNQTKSVNAFFCAADTDGNGVISMDELYTALKKVDENITKKDAQNILSSVDINNDGYITYEELLNTRISRKLQSSESRLKKVFQLLDYDKSGKISVVELKAAMTTIPSIDITDDEYRELISEADINGDGEIDFEEFVQMFVSKADKSTGVK